MDTTRKTLLIRVRNRSDSLAWREFVGLYRPLLVGYARARGLQAEDAEDIAQQCLESISQHIANFDYDPGRGGFKKWLHTLVNNRVRNLLRRRQERLAESGDFERPQGRARSPEEMWEQLWLGEHLKYCLEQIRPQVEPKTYQAFCRVALEQQPVKAVSREIGMTAEQIYVAKSRMTKRLREMMTDLLGEST